MMILNGFKTMPPKWKGVTTKSRGKYDLYPSLVRRKVRKLSCILESSLGESYNFIALYL